MKLRWKRPRIADGSAKRLHLACWIALVLYQGAMYCGTHISGQPNFALTWFDKLEHCGAYGGLMLLWRLALRGRVQSGRLFCYLATFAAFDELTQIPFERTCDPMDWLADMSGLGMGLLATQLLWRLLTGWRWLEQEVAQLEQQLDEATPVAIPSSVTA